MCGADTPSGHNRYRARRGHSLDSLVVRQRIIAINTIIPGSRGGGGRTTAGPVLGQSRAYQDALVRTGSEGERPRLQSRPAIIPVACSDGPPGTWSWSLCCLRPEDAGTDQGSGQASRNIGCRYRVDTVCGQGSVLRAMQTDARYCSHGWRVGKVSPRSYQHATGQPQLIR